MKCSLGISNFLEEISSLSHSAVFLYFFALIAEEGFLISSCYFLELCIQMLISFLFCFAFFFPKKNLFNLILFFNFTILYWFCHISTWIHHRYTCVPHPEPSSVPVPSLWSSQCTSPKHPVSCIEPGLVTRFIYDIIHVSMPFSQIILPSPSPTESKKLVYTSMSLLLSRIQGYRYHLSKFHIYALVYCIGVFFLAYFTLYHRLRFHPPH